MNSNTSKHVGDPQMRGINILHWLQSVFAVESDFLKGWDSAQEWVASKNVLVREDRHFSNAQVPSGMGGFPLPFRYFISSFIWVSHPGYGDLSVLGILLNHLCEKKIKIKNELLRRWYRGARRSVRVSSYLYRLRHLHIRFHLPLELHLKG